MLRWNALRSVILIVLCFSPVMSAEQTKQTSKTTDETLGPHGGEMYVIDGGRYEAVLTSNGLWVYVFDSAGDALPARELRGCASFKDNEKYRTYRYDLYPESLSRNTLYAPIGRPLNAKSRKSADITLHGLNDKSRRPVRFAASFSRILTSEQHAITVQSVCPVSGKRLRSMGQPVKVALRRRNVFVCCKGCVDKLQRNPEFYLGKVAGNERNIRTSIR